MTELKCELVSLYRFEIYYNEDTGKDDDYKYVLISDTLKGLIELIVKREMEWSMNDCRKYLSVRDFLLMPHDQPPKGYHLFDIDEHDIVGGKWISFDEQYYETLFKGDRPHSVDVEKTESVLEKLASEVAGILGKGEETLNCREYEGTLADSLYKNTEVQHTLFMLKKQDHEREVKEEQAGFEAVRELSKITG
jgi:hypothetical protein